MAPVISEHQSTFVPGMQKDTREHGTNSKDADGSSLQKDSLCLMSAVGVPSRLQPDMWCQGPLNVILHHNILTDA